MSAWEVLRALTLSLGAQASEAGTEMDGDAGPTAAPPPPVNATERPPSTPEGMAVAYGSLVMMALLPIFLGSFRSVIRHREQKVSLSSMETFVRRPCRASICWLCFEMPRMRVFRFSILSDVMLPLYVFSYGENCLFGFLSVNPSISS